MTVGWGVYKVYVNSVFCHIQLAHVVYPQPVVLNAQSVVK